MAPNEKTPAAGTVGVGVKRLLGGTARDNSTRGQQFPPYGAEVEALLRAGQPVNLFAFAGTRAWDRARARRHAFGAGSAVVIDADQEADRWRWPRVDAVVLACSAVEPGRALAIARAAVAAGVRCVVIGGIGEPVVVRRSRP